MFALLFSLISLVGGRPEVPVCCGETVVASLRPGLALANPFVGGFDEINRTERDVDSSWSTVWGDRATVRDRFHEETVVLKERGPRGRTLVVTARVYPEGTAVRLTLPDGGEVVDETTTIDYPADAAAWMIDRTEGTYPEEPVSLNGWTDGKERLTPLTVRAAGVYSSFLEAHAVSYPRCRLIRRDGRVKIKLLEDGNFTVKPGASTPWRAFIVGKTPGELIMNATLVANLNPPCALEDTSWIRPGLRFSNLSNCPLREEALECAAEHEQLNNMVGAQLDWGWYGTEWDWSDAQRAEYERTNPEFKNEPTWRDNTRSSPRRAVKGHVPYLPGWKRYTWVDLDVPTYVDYLRQRSMGLSLYVRGKMLEKENVDDLFGLYEHWGLEGVKPGFVRYGSAAATDWNRELIRLAAEHRLTVDIHDEWLTDGIERTYPNLLISEGGGGEEGCHPVHQDVALPFTRCLAGPFDFTPKFFRPGASHAHMAAMLLVYPGPTAVVRGISAARFGKDRVKGWEVWGPERDFVKALPMTYDESYILEAEVARHLTVARRKGGKWFLAGLTGSGARNARIRLDFLPEGKAFGLKLVTDDLRTSDECRMAKVEERTVRKGDVLSVEMDKAGGFVALVVPEERVGWTFDGCPVELPHTWNAVDGADGGAPTNWPGHNAVSAPSYARGRHVYARKLRDPKPGRRYFVRCPAACETAEVFVNGKKLGEHHGAFSSFAFEMTEAMNSSDNRLEIAVDNTYDPHTPPNEGDFTMFGGLYRGVELIDKPDVCIDPTRFVRIETDPATFAVKILVPVLGGEDRTERFVHENAELWSPENPRLYTRKIVVGEDVETVSYAFRKVEFKDGSFYLNGCRRQLRGVCRHQDAGKNGWAASDADIERDIRIIKEMGADAIRTSHYPNGKSFYDLCDKYGLMVWTELPLVDEIPANDPVFAQRAMKMTDEMVSEHYNHPSIVMWGAFNEVYQFRKPDGSAEPLLKDVVERLHLLDKTRPVVGSSNGDKKSLNAISDELGRNLYPGWYWKSVGKMGEDIDESCAFDDRKSIAVSEYGAGGDIGQHGDALECSKWDSDRHTEEYQAYFHAKNYESIKDNPKVWGAFVWAMFDLASDSRNEGACAGLNDKGLVTRPRTQLKDAYWFYRTNWRNDKRIHLVGAGVNLETTNSTMNVLGFSSDGEVTLIVNGEEKSRQIPNGVRTVLFRNVTLTEGMNEVWLKTQSCRSKTIRVVRNLRRP